MLESLRFKVCDFHKLHKSKLKKNIVDNSLAFSTKNKYMYCRIYKSANSTLIATLYNAEKNIQLKTTDEIQSIKDTYFKKASELNCFDLFSLKWYFKFTIVRNPYDRFWSCYYDKIYDQNKPQRKLVLDYLKKDQTYDISPDEFLNYLQEKGINENGHWAPQNAFLIFMPKDYDIIGKVENIQKDVSKITKEIYGKTVPLINVTNHSIKKESLPFAKEKYKSRIHQLYERDFDTFYYSRN